MEFTAPYPSSRAEGLYDVINDRQVQIETEQLLALRKNPHISKYTLRRAYELAFPTPSASEWQSFLGNIFYSLGGALLLCGLFFLVDHFWIDLSHFQRCGLFGGATLLSSAVAWRKGRRLISGKVSLTCTAVLLGCFLIVVTRVGETGEWASVLALWSAFTLPLAIAAEFAPLWLFATALFNVTLGHVCRTLFDPWFFQQHYMEIAYLVLNLTLLTTWEMGFWQGRSWLGRRWFPPILTLAALSPITLASGLLLISWAGYLGQLFPLLPALFLSWAGLLFYYSQVRRDISVLFLTLMSGVFLGTSVMWRWVSESEEPWALLLLAVGILAQVSLALGILRKLTPALPADPKAPPQETPDVRIWLGQLATEGLITSQQVEDMEHAMRVQDEAALPWLVRALIGFAAFVASVLLLLYLLTAGAVTLDNGVFFGLGMCALACFVARVMQSEFITQASLSLSLCGQLTVWLIHTQKFGAPADTALLMAGLQAGLVMAYPGAFGRFLAVNLSGLFFFHWLHLVANPLVQEIFILAVAGLVAAAYLWQDEILPGPLGPAHAPVAVGSVTLLFTLLLGTLTSPQMPPTSGLLAALGLAILVAVAAKQIGASRKTLVGLLSVGLICLSAPGVMGAVLVLLLGFYRRSQTLRGLAIVFLLAFGSAYYYHLAISMLVKSVVMILSGLGFISVARHVDP